VCSFVGGKMYCGLKLFERWASRDVSGPKRGTEKRSEEISCLWRVKNTEYFSDNLKTLSKNYL